MSNTIIISGDQTGTERASLDAALDNKKQTIKIDGYYINNRYAEDGILPSKYILRNLDTDSDLTRNKENLKLANKVLILTVSTVDFDTETIPNFEEKESKIIKLKETLNDNINHINIDSLIEWINNEKIFITGPKENNNNHKRLFVLIWLHEKAPDDNHLRAHFIFGELNNQLLTLIMFGICKRCKQDNSHVSWCKPCDPVNSASSGNDLVDDFLQRALDSADHEEGEKRGEELKVALKMFDKSENIPGREEYNKIRNEYINADKMISDPSNSQKDSDAIYTSRLLTNDLNLKNLPEPKNSDELTASPNLEYFFISDDVFPRLQSLQSILRERSFLALRHHFWDIY
ncbi:6683_t:CDS:2 [Dentiscutata erythropus]|uniref:6683_t:CDS:1 n=1 Tax=Dentiscutata erythropus TaxID=1348616 RepID=A0A9N9I9F7_9GLOM|nr:6683_t:CDS:2 [Dentiscutata erythropus]